MKYQTFVDDGNRPSPKPKHRRGLRCEQKRRLTTHREAVLFAQSMYGGDKPCGYRIYRCPFCEQLHLTSETSTYVRNGTFRGSISPEFDRREKGASWKYAAEQDWFCEWIAQKLASSDDPTLELVSLSERLMKLDSALTPEFLSRLSLPRFSAPGFNSLSAPMEFEMELNT